MSFRNYGKKGDFSLFYIAVKKAPHNRGGRKLAFLYMAGIFIPPLKFTFQLSCQHHLLGTVQASDVDHLGCPYGIAAARTDILSAGACTGDCRWRRRCMCACYGDSVTAVFVAVDENVAQVIVQTEL